MSEMSEGKVKKSVATQIGSSETRLSGQAQGKSESPRLSIRRIRGPYSANLSALLHSALHSVAWLQQQLSLARNGSMTRPDVESC